MIQNLVPERNSTVTQIHFFLLQEPLLTQIKMPIIRILTPTTCRSARRKKKEYKKSEFTNACRMMKSCGPQVTCYSRISTTLNKVSCSISVSLSSSMNEWSFTCKKIQMMSNIIVLEKNNHGRDIKSIKTLCLLRESFYNIKFLFSC